MWAVDSKRRTRCDEILDVEVIILYWMSTEAYEAHIRGSIVLLE